MGKCPDPSDGGSRSPPTEDELYCIEPLQTLSACKAATWGDARDGRPSDPAKVIPDLHVSWGHAPAQHLLRVSADPERKNMRLANCVDDAV